MVKKVTIVGGSGTVGRILIRGLSNEGYDLTVMESLKKSCLQGLSRLMHETMKKR